MKRAVVVTVGCKQESLGAMKLAAWLRQNGWTVDEKNAISHEDNTYSLYAFSVVFSWRIPLLLEYVQIAKWFADDIWIGGPAVTFAKENAALVKDATGIDPVIGIDDRFERTTGQFPMVYFSRGCPAYTAACGLCPVPRIEGTSFRLYPNAEPAPLLLDNNLSALPDAYQDHIIKTYAAKWKKGRVDCNSGFEPHTFNEKTLERWKKFPLACWRFGYDDISERDEALEMMRLLKAHGIKGEKVRVYTLIGNEPKAICQQRMKEVIENGMHPWPQRLRPLSWMSGPLPCLHDWDEPTLIAYQRFYSLRAFWMRLKPEEFYYQGRYPLR